VGIHELRWFTYDPYNWVFVVAAVASIVCLTMRRRVEASESAMAG
jgi:alpha-1,2-mannosyltransferase